MAIQALQPLHLSSFTLRGGKCLTYLSRAQGRRLDVYKRQPLSEGIFRSWASVNLGAPSIDIKVKRPSRFTGFERIYAELEEALAVASVI